MANSSPARPTAESCWRGTVTLNVSPDVVRKQLTIYGSWTFSVPMLGECATLIADRQVPRGRLVTRRFRLEDAALAMADFEAGSAGKGVFVLPA